MNQIYAEKRTMGLKKGESLANLSLYDFLRYIVCHNRKIEKVPILHLPP